MYYQFSLDSIAKNVKVLVDNNRCIVCDVQGGTRWRYPCGHSACGDCVISTKTCLLCLTPSGPGESYEPVEDLPLTKRVKNTQNLLNECHDVFNIDVNRRYRLSEKFKIEKELFPESIQVSKTYYNKKKYDVTSKQKENRLSILFSGEAISPIKKTKMEKTNYVEHWLNKNEKVLSRAQTRKPFRDLNINKQDFNVVRNSKIKHRSDLILDKVKMNVNSASVKETHKRKYEQENAFIHNKIKQIKKDVTDVPHIKCDNNESGIEIDEDFILIEDTQTVDKDQQALLAVIEAEKKLLNEDSKKVTQPNYTLNVTDNNSETSKSIHEKQFTNIKVPFLKKADLFQSCTICQNENTKIEPAKDLSITIENDSFVTTIKMTKITQNTGCVGKNSISIQTDLSDISVTNTKEQKAVPVVVKPSQDVFIEDMITADENMLQAMEPLKTINDLKNGQDDKSEAVMEGVNTSKGVIVAESDSDSDNINSSFTIQCTADVHRSSDQVEGVFNELKSQDIVERNNRTARGITPTSSNSSEKENFNPNKAKRLGLARKKKKKDY